MIGLSGQKTGQKLLSRYQLVALDIIRRIRNGEYIPGERLEGMRVLAHRYGVSIQVIYMAVQQLCASSHLCTEAKRGVFVNPRMGAGHYYRLGVFINELNPAIEAYLIAPLYEETQRVGYDLILAGNYESDFTLADYLDDNPSIDGLILLGYLESGVIQQATRSRIPFLVWGNYGFDEKVPQLCVNMTEMFSVIGESFKKFKGKTLALLFGVERSYSDRVAMENLLNMALAAGMEVPEELRIFSEDDGSHAIEHLVIPKGTDVLYVQGKFLRGVLRYLNAHPEVRRPWLITNHSIFSEGLADQVNEVIKLPDLMVATAREAVRRLIEQIEPQANH